MDEQAILAFARQEAGDAPVELRVERGDGDGYRVEDRGGGMQITGTNARSCLHGVYHVAAGRGPGSFRAAFRVRGVNPCESLARHTPDSLRQLIDRMGRWRMNTLIVHTVYGWNQHRDLIVEECAKRGIELVLYVYTNIEFLPPDAPPAWFAKDPEGKPFTARPECETRLCPCEANGLAAYEEGAREFFRSRVGDACSVLAMTGDGFSHCRCPRCRGVSPVEQWQPALARFAKAGRETAPDKQLEAIIYVQRYRPPTDPTVHQALDRIFFDLHTRNRWCPLGHDHPHDEIWREAEVDPSAAGLPANAYLYDRLAEWRALHPGTVYVFENLYVHATLSCPQPNTGVLLEDLRRFQALGVDGAVYELLPGMDAFLEQMDVIAHALWDPDTAYTPTPLEAWCAEHKPYFPCFFLREFDFPFERFQEEWDPPLRQHLHNLREFFADRSAAALRRAVEHVYAHPERFDRLHVAFFLFKMYCEKAGMPGGLSPAERRFLDITKLWDYMRALDDPIAETDAVVMSLLGN